jgi:acetolactate decarboxylase
MREGVLPLSQFSTIDALMQGIYDGPATFAEVARHGDFGIGTVNHLDGEMIGLGGKFFQITSDGTVHQLPPTAKTSFATVCFFKGAHTATVPKLRSYSALQRWLDSRMGSVNDFWAVRIDGHFSMVRARSISRQKPPYLPLAVVARSESIFEVRNVKGTLVGFRCPPYVRGLNVAGYHFHFLSEDESFGGHVLGCRIREGKAGWQVHRTFQMVLPDDPKFRQADLSVYDEEALGKVER